MYKTKNDFFNLILMLVLFLYFFFSNLSNHNIYSDIAIIILSSFSLILILNKKKFRIDSYFIIYLLFIMYQFLLIVLGQIYNFNATIKVLSTLIINFFIMIMIYNIAIDIGDINKILNIYIYTSFFSLLIIMILLRNSLFTGRLAHAYGENSVSFYFLGNAIGISSNSIAFYCSVSFLLSIHYYFKNKQLRFLLISILLAIGSILTGSRKGILLLFIYSFYFINYNFKKNIVKKVIIGILVSILIYYVVIKIPVFYNIIGERLIALIKKILGKVTNEGSIYAREKYKNYALKLIPKEIIFGYGAGYFSYRYGNVTEINYLEILMTGGILGLCLYYLNYLIIYLRYIKNRAYMSNITNILFIVFLSILIYDIGSVTYAVRNILIVIVFFVASISIDKKGITSERGINNEENYKKDKQ